jgi:hypothetical protein
VKIKQDQLTGIVLVVLGIVISCLVSQFRIDIKPEYPGPKLFPLISVFGFMVCGLGIFIKSTVGKKEEKTFLVKTGWIRAGCTMGVLVLYVFAMTFFGYLIVTPFAAFVLTTLFAKGKKSVFKYRILFSLTFTFVVYGVYVYACGLPLPKGIVFLF